MKTKWVEKCGSPDSIRVDYNRTLSDLLDEGWHEYGFPVWTNVKRDDGDAARCFAQQFVMTEREHDARHKEAAAVASVPDWDDAPEWAEWLAQDGNGAWYWYEERPYKHRLVDEWVPQECADQEGGVYTRFDKVSNGEKNPDWADSLERRPPGKPDWEDAPDWAEWLAQDKDGEWYWYEQKPSRCETYWKQVYYSTRFMLAGQQPTQDLDQDWADSLERRPQPEPEPEQEPLPCPFCGSGNVAALPPQNGQRSRTQCLSCLAVIYADSKQESVRLWNRRAGCD